MRVGVTGGGGGGWVFGGGSAETENLRKYEKEVDLSPGLER